MASLGQFAGRTFGSVSILHKIGSGGMGEVYKGRHEIMGIDVALKIIHPHLADAEDSDFLKRFLREAQTSISLTHPNILRVYTAEKHEDIYYMILEFVDGTDLKQVLRAHRRLDWRRSLSIIEQAAQGLHYAHEKGIIHRDVKPENLLMTTRGEIKIADFGLAMARQAITRMTAVGQVLGSPLYMSPEQCEGLDLDHRTDIYSLGTTWYHLVTGHPPFQAPTAAGILAMHVMKDVPFPAEEFSEFPPELVQCLRGMMQRNRGDRIAYLNEVIDVCRRINPKKTVTSRRVAVRSVVGETGVAAVPRVPDAVPPGGVLPAPRPPSSPHLVPPPEPARAAPRRYSNPEHRLQTEPIPSAAHEPRAPAADSRTPTAGARPRNIAHAPGSLAVAPDVDPSLYASPVYNEDGSSKPARGQRPVTGVLPHREDGDGNRALETYENARASDRRKRRTTRSGYWFVLILALLAGLAAGVWQLRGYFMPDDKEPPLLGGRLAWVAFAADTEGGRDLFTCAPDGSELRQLKNPGFQEEAPRISPNGKWIAYAGSVKGVRQVFVCAWNGEARQALVDANAPFYGRNAEVFGAPSWAADSGGVYVVVRPLRAVGTTMPDRRVYFVTTSGEGRAVKVGERPLEVEALADGRLLVRSGDRLDPESWALTLWRENGSQAPLDLGALGPKAGPRDVRFSPDGEYLVYRRHIQGAGEPDTLFVREVAGSGPGTAHGVSLGAAWLPDGRLLSIGPQGADGASSLFVIDPLRPGASRRLGAIRYPITALDVGRR